MIPRANNAIFRENPSYPEILEYSTSFLDPNRPSDEQGHIHLSPIDSGSPLWKECSNGNAELVAIHNGHIENKAFYSKLHFVFLLPLDLNKIFMTKYNAVWFCLIFLQKKNHFFIVTF